MARLSLCADTLGSTLDAPPDTTGRFTSPMASCPQVGSPYIRQRTDQQTATHGALLINKSSFCGALPLPTTCLGDPPIFLMYDSNMLSATYQTLTCLTCVSPNFARHGSATCRLVTAISLISRRLANYLIWHSWRPANARSSVSPTTTVAPSQSSAYRRSARPQHARHRLGRRPDKRSVGRDQTRPLLYPKPLCVRHHVLSVS